tara:strand:+ start:360 stop:551 length:192 start_codon:yes stop_codon:yes gene_type:complete
MHKDDMTDEDWHRYLINRAVHFQTAPCHKDIVELALDLAQAEIEEMSYDGEDEEIDDYWLREV